jgi:glutamate racemase
VPLVEEGWLRERATYEVAIKYLNPLKKARIDTLILGCTHYPLLKPLFREIMGSKVNLIDSANQLAREVKQILSVEGLAKSVKNIHPQRIFYVSDEPLFFARLAKKFLGYPLACVRKVEDI